MVQVRRGNAEAMMSDDDRAGPGGPDRDDEPGDPACWLRRVCQACGSLADADPPGICAACGAEMPAD